MRSTTSGSLRTWLQRALVVFSLLTVFVVSGRGQCPAVGADTLCGIIITVIATGNAPCPAQGCAAITFSGQGPYDKIEDTLVGVVNNSNLPINSLVLKSSTFAFGFDGDGICGTDPNSPTGAPFSPRPAGCPFGPTTYEGPGVTFSNIVGGGTMGTVNFNPPIPVKGTAYFSLEESLTQATGCSSVINGSVPKPAGGGTEVTAVFTPKLGYTLAQAAQICGFGDWNWQQTVTHLDPCAVFTEAGSATPLKAPFNDPPPNGYAYQVPPNAVHLPVYYNIFAAIPGLSLSDHKKPAGNPTMLDFFDGPAVGCLSGAADGVTGKHVSFTNHLVGLVGAGPGFGVQDTGIGFSYTTTYNGTNGGIAVLNTNTPVDPGSGTGSIAITGYNDTTTYQFPKGLAVTAINGNPVTASNAATSTLLGGNVVSVVASGLAYSRLNQVFFGTVTMTNVSGSTLGGPFQIVLDSLTSGVTVANATGSFGGWLYITVPEVASLAPGASASVTVQFKDPGNLPINFSPVPYSGGFN